MAFTLLRRTITPNSAGSSFLFRDTSVFFNTETRRPYATQTDSQLNNPFELAKDAEVYRYEYRPGRVRGVFYNGNGSVYTKNLAGAGVSSLLVKADTTAPYTTDSNATDASVDLTGTLGQPPYQLVLVGTIGTPSAGYRQTATSYSENYPVRFYNLARGEYVAQVIDALGYQSFLSIFVAAGTGLPRGVRLLERRLLVASTHLRWRFNNLDIRNYAAPVLLPYGEDILPYGTYVDGFLVAGGAQWRQVYSDGKGGVYPIDTSTASSSSLELDNVIQFNPDTAAEQNGAVLVEVLATAKPLSYRLTGTTAAGPIAPQTNATGNFEGLAAGEYSVLVTDAVGNTLPVPFSLQLNYALWQQLVYDDLQSRPLRLELWLRGYKGAVGNIYGQAQPVSPKSDGLSSSLGGQGDIPPVVGTSVALNLLVPPALMEPVVIGDDRLCRVDVYYNNKLEFRGYVQPDIYEAPLLDGLQPVSMTATDGLATLKDTDMLGHIGQRLHGHRPILNTLLHCLSRCGISLPLRIYTNRRDATMSDDDAPELVATTNRTGYWDEDKNEPDDQRTVTDALAQALGGTLCLRAGAWEVRSALEALLDAPGRAYGPGGVPAGALVAVAPTATVRPPGPARLHWLNGDQAKQVRAGWKSLTGTTDTGWLKNAFPAGAVFSDKNAWLPDFSRLRPVAGWHPAPGSNFPLIFQRAGDKGTDYATEWPRSLDKSISDSRYLESPLLPLAAGTEAVPAYLTITGKLVPTEYYQDAAGNAVVSPSTATKAVVVYEVVVDGQSTGRRLAELTRAASGPAKDVTFEAPLPPLPSTAGGAVLRVHSWIAADTGLLTNAPTPVLLANYAQGEVVKSDFGTGVYRLFVARQDITPAQAFTTGGYTTLFAEIPATNVASGQLLISSIAIQLRPQQATWDGEDNFRADGPAGTVRPTEALKVYHPDVPLSAGLFGGNLYAFGRGVGLLDGTMSTSWARKIDLDATPLFEANVLDALALRAGPSRLLKGTLLHQGVEPPRLLDSLDTPFDVPGRRFLVAAIDGWDMKAAEVEVSLVEIGPGAGATVPPRPVGVRLTHRAYAYYPGQYTPVPRRTHAGRYRVRHL